MMLCREEKEVTRRYIDILRTKILSCNGGGVGMISDKEKEIIEKFTRVTSIKSTKQQSVTDKTTQRSAFGPVQMNIYWVSASSGLF